MYSRPLVLALAMGAAIAQRFLHTPGTCTCTTCTDIYMHVYPGPVVIKVPSSTISLLSQGNPGILAWKCIPSGWRHKDCRPDKLMQTIVASETAAAISEQPSRIRRRKGCLKAWPLMWGIYNRGRCARGNGCWYSWYMLPKLFKLTLQVHQLVQHMKRFKIARREWQL